MKRLMIAVAVLLLVMMFPAAASADDAYDIVSYDVHIVVSENNIADVTETMTYNFTQERHGIYYYLQYKGTLYHKIGDEWFGAEYKQWVTDFKVEGHEYDLSRETYGNEKYLFAKIGDADEYVFGEQVYKITYTCDMGDNGFETFDEFNRGIANCDYGDTIENASFTIELPKDFDASSVIIGIGEYDYVDEQNVVWEKNGSTITGYTTRPIEGGESLLVRAVMDDDYFVGESDFEAGWNNAVLIISGACVLLALLLWILFGRDNPMYPTVEFYAPGGMTPAEAGYVIDGSVDDKDVISLILYWADKGYLNIIEESKKDFSLLKLKDLPSDVSQVKSFERTMFKKLFAKGDAVTLKSLEKNFYTTMNATKTSVTNYFEASPKRRIYTKQSKKARGWMGIVTMLPIAFAIFVYGYLSMDEILWSAVIAVLAGWFISLPVFMMANTLEKWRGMKPGGRVAKLIISIILIFIVMLLYIIIMPLSAIGATFITTIATVICAALTVIMRKRTKQGIEWMGKLIGFKNFIDKAEKDRILMLVEENPSYFFNVLPYAYVLGVTDKWAKNFEDIGVQPPRWYSGAGSMQTFNTVIFASAMTRNMGSFRSSMTSRPSSGSSGSGFRGGGGFGGGGFSGGGGGGGGGGGSW